MVSNDELKEVIIKTHLCYYFSGIITIEDFNFGNILTEEISHKNIFGLWHFVPNFDWFKFIAYLIWWGGWIY